MTNYIVPCLILLIVGYGIATKTDVYSAMIDGAKQGIKMCMNIFPAILIMLTSVAMLRASGAVDFISNSLAPIFEPLGIPRETLPLALLRPFTGSGALSVASEILIENGPDSVVGKIASVMMGSSETSFYTIAVYSAYTGMKNTRWAVPAAVSADITAFVMSAVSVRLLMRF